MPKIDLDTPIKSTKSVERAIRAVTGDSVTLCRADGNYYFVDILDTPFETCIAAHFHTSCLETYRLNHLTLGEAVRSYRHYRDAMREDLGENRFNEIIAANHAYHTR